MVLSDNWVVNWQVLELFVANLFPLMPWNAYYWRWFDVCLCFWWASSFCNWYYDGNNIWIKFQSLIFTLQNLLTEFSSSKWMHLPSCQLLMLFPQNIPFGLHWTAKCILFSNYCLRRVCLVLLVLPKWEAVGMELYVNSRSANRFLNCTINGKGF